MPHSEKADNSSKSIKQDVCKPPKNGKQTAADKSRLPKSKSNETIEKKSKNSYESKYTLIDISEEKMRNFVMGQLRYFDCRTDFEDMHFYEEYFVA